MSRRGWLLFAAMGVIWGIPYLLIKVAIRDLEPGFLVFARTLPAALLLLPLALRRGRSRDLVACWHWVLAYTVVEVALPWFLLGTAEEHVSSAFAGLLVAAVPLIGAVLVVIFGGDERLSRRRIVGLLIGFAGVAALLGLDVSSDDLAAPAQILLVAVCYATGPLIVARKLSGLSSLDVVTASFVITAIAYSPYAATHRPSEVSGDVIAAVVILAVVCSAAAFLIFFELIAEVGPARATVITYINPAVAVLLGVLILDEPFTLGIAIGLPVVLLGSFLATVPSRAPEPEEPGLDLVGSETALPVAEP